MELEKEKKKNTEGRGHYHPGAFWEEQKFQSREASPNLQGAGSQEREEGIDQDLREGLLSKIWKRGTRIKE